MRWAEATINRNLRRSIRQRLQRIFLVALFFFLLTIPHGSQTPSPNLSPTAFILLPQPFETLPSRSPCPILAVAILPFPSALDYTFGELWLMVGEIPFPLAPLSDQPFYDPQTETFYAFYWGMIEGLPEGRVPLEVFALFLPLSPHSSPLWVKSGQMLIAIEDVVIRLVAK